MYRLKISNRTYLLSLQEKVFTVIVTTFNSVIELSNGTYNYYN